MLTHAEDMYIHTSLYLHSLAGNYKHLLPQTRQHTVPWKSDTSTCMQILQYLYHILHVSMWYRLCSTMCAECVQPVQHVHVFVCTYRPLIFAPYICPYTFSSPISSLLPTLLLLSPACPTSLLPYQVCTWEEDTRYNNGISHNKINPNLNPPTNNLRSAHLYSQEIQKKDTPVQSIQKEHPNSRNIWKSYFSRMQQNIPGIWSVYQVTDTESYLYLQQSYWPYNLLTELKISMFWVLSRPYNQGTYGSCTGMTLRPLTVWLVQCSTNSVPIWTALFSPVSPLPGQALQNDSIGWHWRQQEF